MSNIYRNIVEVHGTLSISPSGIAKHYVCSDNTGNTDYDVVLPSANLLSGDLISIEGHQSLQATITLTCGNIDPVVFINGYQTVTLQARGTYLLRWNGDEWVVCYANTNAGSGT
jgi:hypothetical protein